MGAGRLITVLPIHTDAAVRSFGNGKTVVINRFGQDSLYVLDKGSNAIRAQLALKKGANPQDVSFVDNDTLIITQRSESDLVKWNTKTGAKETVSLARMSHSGGIPDMMMLTQANGNVWVSLQRLQDRIRPSDHSLVAVIPPAGEARSFRLMGTNPVTAFKTDLLGNLFLGCAGNLGAMSENDGGIERLDPHAERSEKVVISEKELGGDLIDFEILDDKRGVALISLPETELVVFNVQTGKRERSLLKTSKYDLVRLSWDKRRQRLYVADRTKERPAIREFSTENLTELRAIPVTVPVWEMEIEEP